MSFGPDNDDAAYTTTTTTPTRRQHGPNDTFKTHRLGLIFDFIFSNPTEATTTTTTTYAMTARPKRRIKMCRLGLILFFIIFFEPKRRLPLAFRNRQALFIYFSTSSCPTPCILHGAGFIIINLF